MYSLITPTKLGLNMVKQYTMDSKIHMHSKRMVNEQFVTYEFREGSAQRSNCTCEQKRGIKSPLSGYGTHRCEREQGLYKKAQQKRDSKLNFCQSQGNVPRHHLTGEAKQKRAKISCLYDKLDRRIREDHQRNIV